MTDTSNVAATKPLIDAAVLGAITDGQKAVVEKYGFRVTEAAGGGFRVHDPVLNPSGKAKTGIHTGTNLDIELRKAVTERKAHDTKGTAVQPEKPAKDAAPPVTIKGKVKLDNTGKREKVGKKNKEPKAPRENRYQRTAKLIIAKPDITDDQLAKAADCSLPAARYCLEAWVGITGALSEAGFKVPVAKKPAPPAAK